MSDFLVPLWLLDMEDSIVCDGDVAGHEFYGNQYIGGMSFSRMSPSEKASAILKAKKILQPAVKKTMTVSKISAAVKLLNLAEAEGKGKGKPLIHEVKPPIHEVKPTAAHTDYVPKENVAHLPGGVMLNEQEALAVSQYTGNGFYQVNNHLRHQAGLFEPSSDLANAIKHMDSAIDKAVLEEPKTFFRSVDRNAAKAIFGEEIQSGMIIEDKGFVSTSKSAEFAKGWQTGGVVLHIEVPKGGRALDVQSISAHSTEKEVILPRGSKFKVMSVKVPAEGEKNIIVKVTNVYE